MCVLIFVQHLLQFGQRGIYTDRQTKCRMREFKLIHPGNEQKIVNFIKCQIV